MTRFISLFLLLIVSKWSLSSANDDSDLLSRCTHRLPQAIIIGVKKSGTFALLKYLGLNPRIKAAIRNPSNNSSNRNEIHFFDRDTNWAKGLDWYKDQMPLVCDLNKQPSTVVIEKTPGYFRSLDMLEWIKYFNIGEQILIVDGERFIREPWHQLNRVERFLGLNESISRNDFYFDRRKRFFCASPGKSTSEMGKCLGKNKGRQTHIFLSEYVRDGLQKFYLNWNQRFFDLIGNKFDWS